jgi:hypothetical protein
MIINGCNSLSHTGKHVTLKFVSVQAAAQFFNTAVSRSIPEAAVDLSIYDNAPANLYGFEPVEIGES